MDIDIKLEKIKRKTKEKFLEDYNLELVEEKEGVLYNHERYISFVIPYGFYELNIGLKKVEILENNVLFIKGKEKIEYKALRENKKMFILNFHKRFFDNYLVGQMADCPIIYDFFRLENKTTEYLLFDIAMENILKIYLKILLFEINKEGENTKSVKASLILFLSNLHDYYKETLIITESTMMEDYDIGKWLKYMADNYDTVTLTSMAKEFNFNPTYFSARFKTLAKCHFSEKLKEIKLEKAKWLLITTNLSVSSISEIIGFKEKSYFHKIFKEKYKMTPLQYRKNSKGV